jgi:hypothetical protein
VNNFIRALKELLVGVLRLLEPGSLTRAQRFTLIWDVVMLVFFVIVIRADLGPNGYRFKELISLIVAILLAWSLFRHR